MKLVAALTLAVLPSAGLAAHVGPCDGAVNARYLVEPWGENAATYAEGAIRVALFDNVEPAGAALHLMVISPPRDETGMRQCRRVSLEEGSGFYNLDFAARSADYDLAKGLTLTIPAERYDPDTGGGAPARLRVTIDQNTGAIAAGISP
ncbi:MULTISPECIES: hypothetical protein [unclassified Paracoccus (in: a-proteobacteria)]|uniref:hypothetical protein n=1 Tax=unclassified Paracoccus (in: a-proteobacteria) TaxID=2688777 RepID=UPI0016009109|nr:MULTISPECIES: hypothetical protein [unclassified Paracoccus (in: a-proteobacteria)]MBB1492563.1 hypothetical protein [Paracoccus sp. MC1854]MBB1498386.1 hypothetical protein [Paracoccus sp. MC1862]QQO44406.1 hypothetical protein JGR78_13750 [Paracoccus sp. MC1862]